jgi:O-Antigen ligase
MPVLHGARGSAAIRRALLIALPMVLAGYALFDQPFANLHVPGTPLYLGEVVLALGAALAVLATPHFRLALRHSLPMGLLLTFIAWGFVRTVPFVPVDGVNAVRDAALWYYALTVVLVVTLVRGIPELPSDWVRRYGDLVLALLVWSPIALVLSPVGGPLIPDSDVQLFSHREANLATAIATGIAFLWLVPRESLKPRSRALLTALATLLLLAVATQNRGGGVAAVVALLVAGALMGRDRLKMATAVLGTVLVVLILAWGLDARVTLKPGRDFSVNQLWQNVASITQADQASGQLGGNVQFRVELWSGVLNLASDRGALLSGLGFGPNLAQELGVSAGAVGDLRNPHNSHVDVLARMGFVGGILWLAFWISWGLVLLRRLRNRDAPLSALHAGIVRVCLVGVTAILVNAFFDPTLETPQVALWLWTLVGLGLGLTSQQDRALRDTPLPRTPPQRHVGTRELAPRALVKSRGNSVVGQFDDSGSEASDG